MADQRVVLVTGTSSGLGLATRTRLEAAGWRVFGSARRPDGTDPAVLPLDVTDDRSVSAAIDAVLESAGRLDAVVNNAGVDLTGAVEETTVEEAQALFDTDFFGVHRVVRAALPHLRERRGSRIVVIGSLSAFVPIPFDGFYTAAKHALEGYVETLQFEVAPFGVRCTVVEPGFIRTALRDRKQSAAERLPVYAAARRRAADAFDRGVARGTSPERVADAVARVLASPRPPLHRQVGLDSRALRTLRAVLPPAAFQAGMRRVF